jgi:hypothetical protein
MNQQLKDGNYTGIEGNLFQVEVNQILVRRKPATVRWKLHRDRYGEGNQIRIEET